MSGNNTSPKSTTPTLPTNSRQEEEEEEEEEEGNIMNGYTREYDTCEIMYGCTSSPNLCYPNICLVTSTDAVTCRNYGETANLVNVYPYGDVATRRRMKPGSNIAVLQDRGDVASVVINKPANNTVGPTIATMITQFGIGSPIEYNSYAQNMQLYSEECEYVHKLTRDTTINRIYNFSDCTSHLLAKLRESEYDYINLVVIPMGIGRADCIDTTWLNDYFPLLIYLGYHLRRMGKRCVLITLEDEMKQCFELGDGDIDTRFWVHHLKKLEVINLPSLKKKKM